MKQLLFVAVIVLAFVIAVPAFACGQKPNNRCWDPTGEYVIDFTCTSGCSGDYIHTMDIESINVATGVFSGTGFYNTDPSYYTWDVNGTMTDSSLVFTILYTGSNVGYTVNASGTIAADGTISGTATGPGQEFTWKSTSGAVDSVKCSQGHFIKWWKDKDWKAWYLSHFKNWGHH